MKAVIYGNGAMARVFHSFARRDWEIAGFTVDDHICDRDTFCNLPLVPFSSVETVFPPQTHTMITAIGFMEMNQLRITKYEEAIRKGYRLPSYVHPSVILHDGVEIADNCIIFDHVSIHPGCRIGHSTFISSNVNVGHDCTLEPGTWINSGVAIAGGCRIGEGCFFGVNASVAQGIAIGRQNFIAANTLINRRTDDQQVHVSAPGQLFRLSSPEFLKFSRLSG